MQIPIPQGAAAVAPLPSPDQLRWQRSELAVFVHFTVNAFTGREWGDGRESPSIFNPEQLDTRQWASAAAAAGARHMVLTAKHHDGFCLWPSAFTDHSVKSSPWKGGKGDVVREFVEACGEHHLRPGLYLSPWDRHEPSYGDSPRYNAYYLNQLRELLTNYGELAEIWFDGACAEGPNGRRQEYDWAAYFRLCKQLQPHAVTFGDGGTDVRWCGNERGIAGDPCWSMVSATHLRFPGDAVNDQATDAVAQRLTVAHQLQHGQPQGDLWRPAENDVSIRPGWFYHAQEDHAVRSVENLVDLYFRSVGRNGFLLLNVPPTPRGLFHEIDVDRLGAFRRRLDAIFARDQAEGARVDQPSEQVIELHFPQPRTFDVIDLREPIELGQRIASHRVSCRNPQGQWSWLLEGHTIGCRKLERLLDPVTGTVVRLEITRCRPGATPGLISEIGLYLT